MESVATKIQETGQHVAKKSDALLARTREAGETFFGEVQDAGRELIVLVRSEAKGWRRFITQRTSLFEHEARDLFAAKAIERQILTQVGGALRTLDKKVRERLLAIEKKGGARSSRRTANGAGRRGARKARAGASSAKSAASAASPAVRH